MRTTFKHHNKLGKDIIKTTESQAKWVEKHHSAELRIKPAGRTT